MLDLRKKLGELTGFVKGSVAEGLYNLRAGIQETSTTAVTAVGNAVIDNVAAPILDAKDAYDKKVRQDKALATPPVSGPITKTLTRNLEGLPPISTVVDPGDSNFSDTQAASAINSVQPQIPPVVEEPKLNTQTELGKKKFTLGSDITKDKLVFQEHKVGNGIPYVKTDNGKVSILDIAKNLEVNPPEKPIKRLVISDPEEGIHIIDTPEKLSIANEIKAITDKIAPEYTNYLLKLAQKEGLYNSSAFRGEKDNPGGGDDRGIFQINSKSFPDVTKEMADDLRFSILWAISRIESGTPKKGDGRYTGQEVWIADPAARRSSITIED